MDHESTATISRPILPPISSMDGFLASRSWPPPATSLASTSLASPSAGSTSSNITMQESSTLSPPLSRNKHEPWSPIPKQKDNQPKLDYFTMTANPSTLPSAAENYHYRDHHYRQNSLPQISTFRKSSISSSSYQSPSDQQRFEVDNASITSGATGSSSTNNNNTSIELVLTPNSLSSPSIRNIERDIEEASFFFLTAL
jgi:hypothetical protein